MALRQIEVTVLRWVDDYGQILVVVHEPSLCAGEHCVLHNPSDHSMRDFKIRWREAGMFDIKPSHFERICEHGIGHPDPDSAAFLASIGVDVSVHGCDGCCNPALHVTEANINGAEKI